MQPAATVSEESCSDTASYVIKGSIEARDIGKTDVEVTGKSKDDAYECTPAGKNGFPTCVQVTYPFNIHFISSILGYRKF